MCVHYISKGRTYAPESPPHPPPRAVCSRTPRCQGCPYPAHGFRCWNDSDGCLRETMNKISHIKKGETEHERGVE